MRVHSEGLPQRRPGAHGGSAARGNRVLCPRKPQTTGTNQREGGVVISRIQAPNPYEWHTFGSDPVSGRRYMNAHGVNRAQSARDYYSGHAPQGGY